MIDLTIYDAGMILTTLHAHQDRIIYRGKTTTPYRLYHDEDRARSAKNVRVQFRSRSGRLSSGTLHDMVKDRLRVK